MFKLKEVYPSLRRRYPVQVLRVRLHISAVFWLTEVLLELSQILFRSRNIIKLTFV